MMTIKKYFEMDMLNKFNVFKISSLTCRLIYFAIFVICTNTFSYCSDIRLDSIKKVIVVPFDVRYSQAPSIKDMKDWGVTLKLSKDEARGLALKFTTSEFQPEIGSTLDARILIIGIRGDKTKEIMLDKTCFRFEIDGKLVKANLEDKCELTILLKRILKNNEQDVSCRYKNKTYGSSAEGGKM